MVPDKTYLQRIREGEKKVCPYLSDFIKTKQKSEVRGYCPFTFFYCAPEVQSLFVYLAGIFYAQGIWNAKIYDLEPQKMKFTSG